MGESRPVGRALMIGALLVKGKFLLKIHGLSYVVLRLNYELAKMKGTI